MDPARHRPLLALLIRLGAIAALSTMSALIKLANARGVHLLEIMFWRQFVTLPILLGWVLATSGSLRTLKTDRPGKHFLRSLYGTIGMVLNFGAVILLPLAEATVMNFTTPIWATMLAIAVRSGPAVASGSRLAVRRFASARSGAWGPSPSRRSSWGSPVS